MTADLGAAYGPLRLVEFVRSGAEPAQGMCHVDELRLGDVWRDPECDPVTVWWRIVDPPRTEQRTDPCGDPDPLVHINSRRAPDPHG